MIPSTSKLKNERFWANRSFSGKNNLEVSFPDLWGANVRKV